MVLSSEQIKELLKGPKKKSVINKAVRHENRIRFHVESFMETSDISQTTTVFLDWVKTLIPKDKYAIFLNLFQFPLPTVQLTNTIFSELERVFDSKNPANNYQFTASTYRDEWEWYRTHKLNEATTWRKKCWETFKTSINSVIIVDLPQTQETEYPEPYFYFLDISNVIDYDYRDEKLEFIIFRQPDNKIAAFDDTYYRVYQLNGKGEIVGEPVEVMHNLGFCPARFFWSTPLNQKQPDIKRSPLSSQLANLDWLLFFSISKRHLDLYAPYPIYSAYSQDCDYENSENGDHCDGGYLRNSNNQYSVYSDGSLKGCPKCSDKKLAGVGSFIEVPAPITKDDADLRDPITITTIDKTSLDYNVEEVKRLALETFKSVVGIGGDGQHKESVNEVQVLASFDSKTSVLNALKGNFEAAKKFVDDTCCTLRYGDNFLGSSISMGTEFYVYSVGDLYDQFKRAKENGASDNELNAISEQIITTEYRNNPLQMERMLILKHLEPYRHYTFDELMTLQDKTLLDDELLQIKLNFSSYIDRFERENTNVTEFASQIDFNNKISIIFKTLQTYGKDRKTTVPVKPGGQD